jgi:hypothetical protein
MSTVPGTLDITFLEAPVSKETPLEGILLPMEQLSAIVVELQMSTVPGTLDITFLEAPVSKETPLEGILLPTGADNLSPVSGTGTSKEALCTVTTLMGGWERLLTEEPTMEP